MPAIVRELPLGIAGPMAVYLMFAQVLVNIDLWMLKSLWTGPSDMVGHYVASGNLARILSLVPAVRADVLFISVARAMTAGPAVLLKISALSVISLFVLLASRELTWKDLGLHVRRPAHSAS